MSTYDPCPHCGNGKLSADASKTSDGRWLFAVKCPKCNSMTWEAHEDLEAAKITVRECWNSRAEGVDQ